MSDLKLYDLVNATQREEELQPKPQVVVVDIDEKSLQQLGQWPWPRVLLADMVQKIADTHASTIVMDIIFAEQDRTSPSQMARFYKEFFHIEGVERAVPQPLRDNDTIFAQVLQRNNVVGSLYLSDERLPHEECVPESLSGIDTSRLLLKEYGHIMCNTPVIQKALSHSGFVNSYKDRDGILRRMPLFEKYKSSVVPSMALAALLSLDGSLQQIAPQHYRVLGRDVRCDEHGRILLHFYPSQWYKKISAIDVMRGNFDVSLLQGKIVIIGSSSVGLHDTVTVSGLKEMTGSHIHMTMLQNILDESYVLQPQYYKLLGILFSVVVTFVLFFFLVSKRNLMIVTLFFFALAGSVASTKIALVHNVYISIGYFLIPFVFHFIIVSFLYILIEAYQRYRFNMELGRTQMALLDSMVYVAEIHDTETGAHIMRTKLYVKALAEYLYYHGIYKEELSKEKIEIMYNTAPLHDIGKIGIPDAVLKKPGKLDKEEFDIIKQHPQIGGRIIDNAILAYEKNEFFLCARNIAMYHHEKWDGSGYPEGLKGSEIPLESRLMALADVFDALVSRRVYKESFDYAQIRRIIIEGKGTHFDPKVVDAFLAIEYKFHEIAAQYHDNVYENTTTKDIA